MRHLRAALPRAEIVFVLMHVRADLPQTARTGTKAWVDSGAEAEEIYTKLVPSIYSAIGARYEVRFKP